MNGVSPWPVEGTPNRRRRALAVTVTLMLLVAPLLGIVGPAVGGGGRDGGDGDRAALHPDEWLTFKGDIQRTGVAASEAPSVDKVLWSANYRGSLIYSSPTVWNGTVYVGVAGSIKAIWAKNGTERWSYTAPNPVHSTPVISDGIIYAGVNDFSGTSAIAVDAITGREVWNASIPDFVTSSPLVVGNSVYAGCENGLLYCLRRSDGSERWNFTAAGPIRYGSIAYDNDRVFFGTMSVGSQDGRLYAVHAQSGIERWNKTVVGSVWSSPAIVGGMVMTASAADNSLSPEFRNGYVYAFNTTTGAQVWRTRNLGMVFASPSIHNDRAYVGTYGKIIPPDIQLIEPQMYCLDVSDGGIIWNRTVNHQGENAKVWSSVTIAGSKVIFGDELGYMNVWNVFGVRIWSYAISRGAAVKTSPAVASEMIFAANTMGDVVGFGSQPDLVVNATAISLGDELPHLGQRVDVWARVTNIGDKTATGRVFLYNGSLEDWDTVINSTTVTLAPGESTTAHAVWTADEVGNRAVWVRIMDVRPNEADETNNEAKRVVEVLPPSEGWLTARSDPSGDGFAQVEVPTNNITKWLRAEGADPGPGVVATLETVFFPVGQRLVAMDRLEGNVLWSKGLGGIPSTPPGVGDGAIFVGTEAGTVVAFDLEGGDIRFRSTLDGPVTAGPTVVGWTALVGTSLDGEGTLYALDTFDGTVQWSRAMNAPVRAHPAEDNGSVFALSDDGAVMSLDLDDGGLRWQYPVGNPPGRNLTASPVISDDRLFVASSSGFVYCLDADPTDGVDEGKTDPDGSEYDVLWTYRKEVLTPFNASPVLVSGRLVLLTEEQRLLALDGATGNISWSVPIAQFGPATTDLIALNDSIVLGGQGVRILSAEDGVELWRYSSATATMVGNPAAVDGMLFLSDARGILFAFGNVENLPPIARISSPQADEVFRINESITFDASATTDDKELPETAFHWDFGDGNISLSRITSHRYAMDGQYTVVLTVTDEEGENDTASVNVRVLGNHGPILDWWDVTPDQGFAIRDQFNFTVRYTDPDNDPPETLVMRLSDEPEYQPLTMFEVDRSDVDHTDGKMYYFAMSLGSRPYPGVSFFASDGIATTELVVSGPTVLVTDTFRNSVGDIEVTVTYVGPEELEFSPVSSPPQTFPAGLHPIGVFVELDLETTFLKAANLSINYTFHSHEEMDIDSLAIYRWSVTDSTAAWDIILSSHVDKGREVVTADIPSLQADIYTILGNMKPEPQNQLPVPVIQVDGKRYAPNAEVDKTYKPGEVIDFDATLSSDPDEELGDMIVEARWSFGDGVNQKGMESSHRFERQGKYTVELTVTDSRGGQSSVSVVIDVRLEEQSTLLYILVLIGIIVILLLLFYPKGGSRMSPEPRPETKEEKPKPPEEKGGDEGEDVKDDEPQEDETEIDDIIDELEEDRKS